jgi:hypothetical protein
MRASVQDGVSSLTIGPEIVKFRVYPRLIRELHEILLSKGRFYTVGRDSP